MNFTNKEIMSKNKQMPPMSLPYLHFTLALQEFRDWYNKSMKINCWYRDPQYNKEVGGDKSSNHLVGTAVDWSIRGIVDNMSEERLEEFRIHIANKWISLGEKYGYEVQIELNPTWIHLAFGVLSSKNFSRIGLANGATNKIYSNKFKSYYGQKNCPSILKNKGKVRY